MSEASRSVPGPRLADDVASQAGYTPAPSHMGAGGGVCPNCDGAFGRTGDDPRRMWIIDVATTAKMAYGLDSNYTFTMVSEVMTHEDKLLDKPLRYNHLENALFMGLRGAIKTVALSSDVRVRMMEKRSEALRLMKMMIEYFCVPEENEDMLHANALSDGFGVG